MDTEEVTISHPKRSCTDLPCLLVFFIFVGLMVIIAAFAYVYGNPLRLTNGYDSFGNICGTANEAISTLSYSGMDMTDKKYLFFLNINWNVFTSLKLCVRKCPDREIRTPIQLQNFARINGSFLCRYDLPLENYTRIYEENGSTISWWKDVCPDLPVFASVPVLRRCVPKATQDVGYKIIYNIHAYLNNIEVFQQALSDFYICWKSIFGLSVFSVAVSYLMVISIHLFANFVSWILISFLIVLAVAAVAFTVTLWMTYASNKAQLDRIPEAELLVEMVRNESAFLVYSIVATIITIILLLVMFYLRKKIGKVVILFKEASACIQDMRILLLQPIWTCLTLFCFVAFWISVTLCLSTANHASRKGLLTTTNAIDNQFDIQTRQLNVNLSDIPYSFQALQFEEHTWVRSMWWVYVIAFVWISEFILACQQMVIAGAVAIWYFEREKEQLSCPVFTSTRKLVLYHIGSLALGSFLITIFKVPRLLLKFFDKQFKKVVPKWCEGCVNCFKWCCTCCLWSFEKFIRYMNHNAYTIIALRGESFCPASRRAFITIFNNAAEIAIIDSVGDCILFFGKCVVAIITGFVGLLIFKHDPQLHFYAIPILVLCAISFFIAHCFFSVYEMVIDTLVLCMCEDSSLHSNKIIDRPFATESLKTFLRQPSMATKPSDDDDDETTPVI